MYGHRMFEAVLSITSLLAGASALAAAFFAGPSFADDAARPVKIMIINISIIQNISYYTRSNINRLKLYHSLFLSLSLSLLNISSKLSLIDG